MVLPERLEEEVKKATKIIRDFTMPTADKGPDQLISPNIIKNAQGLAVISVLKAGFLVTVRGGSGIVVARVDGGEWSAPSAISIAGLGGGFQIGVEVTDFLIILNSRKAVQAFSKGGNLTLGGNFTVAAGPIGRNAETAASVKSVAAIYTYSKSKGIFAGISIEGSGLVERKEANNKFYGDNIRAHEILNGELGQPEAFASLYKALSNQEEAAARASISSMGSSPKESSSSRRSFRSSVRSKPPHQTAAGRGHGPSKQEVEMSKDIWNKAQGKPQGKPQAQTMRVKGAQSTVRKPAYQMPSWDDPPAASAAGSSRGAGVSGGYGSSRAGSKAPASAPAPSKPTSAKALFNFDGEMPCDLIFKEGDTIEVLTRTHTTDDWWEGRVHGKTGLFPASYTDAKA